MKLFRFTPLDKNRSKQLSELVVEPCQDEALEFTLHLCLYKSARLFSTDYRPTVCQFVLRTDAASRRTGTGDDFALLLQEGADFRNFPQTALMAWSNV